MRQFEINDVERAMAGDKNAQLRVERRKDILAKNSEQRRAAMQFATPAWANRKAIRKIYAEAKLLTEKTGVPHEVDHIVPIQGATVCGLHVEHNLQILPKTDNVRKHANFSDWEKLPRGRRKVSKTL